MDWGTVALSALTSAIVSTLVSLLVVGTRVRTEDRERRSLEARRTLSTEAAAKRKELRRYTLSKDAPPARDGESFHYQDVIDARPLWEATTDLRWFRRWRARRLLRGVYGDMIPKMVDTYKGEDSDFLLAMAHGWTLEDYRWNQAMRESPRGGKHARAVLARLNRLVKMH